MTETLDIELQNTGDGATTARIQVEGPPVTWHQLGQLAEILGRARTPISITFAPYGPPPEFLSRQDVARVLGTTDYHVRKLAQAGVLTEIPYNEGYPKEQRPVVNPGGPCWKCEGRGTVDVETASARPTVIPCPTCGGLGRVDKDVWPNPNDPATRHVYRYDQVLAVARQAVKTGHLPVVAKDKLARTRETTGMAVFELVMQKAQKPLTKEEIRRRVSDYYKQTDNPQPISRHWVDKYTRDYAKDGRIHNVAPRVVAGRQPPGEYVWGPAPETGPSEETGT